VAGVTGDARDIEKTCDMKEEKEGDTMKERYWGTGTSTPVASYDSTSWRELAACRSYDPELFFPIGKAGLGRAEVQRAKAVCAGCPVRQACLDFALRTGQEFGVWGGYDEDERRVLRRPRRMNA
jgi:WhiB family redox-sensing transcriptional regulator